MWLAGAPPAWCLAAGSLASAFRARVGRACVPPAGPAVPLAAICGSDAALPDVPAAPHPAVPAAASKAKGMISNVPRTENRLAASTE